MEQFLGDYGRARHPFPIFSLSRHDALLTMFLCLLCLYIAVAVRVGQPVQVSGNSPWKGICVVFGTIWGIIFAIVAACKVFCGYGDYQQQSAYQQLDDHKEHKESKDPTDILRSNGYQEETFHSNGRRKPNQVLFTRQFLQQSSL